MRNFLLGIIITLVVVGIGVVGFLYGQRKPSSTNNIVPTITITPTIEQLTPTVDEGELIKTALFQKNNWQESDDITVKISTNDGKYASGTATAQGGGGYFYAVKDSGIWIIVADGNGVIECSSLSKYSDYPKTLIPECYNSATGKSVKR